MRNNTIVSILLVAHIACNNFFCNSKIFHALFVSSYRSITEIDEHK
ncbi:hypothetical protein NVIRPANT_00995 [Pantoea sp. Nvir]|nr:hypothetical protein NVIRPANT_00995 [Pantoea sp. Nvir]